MYACSPKWPADWICEEDATQILTQLGRTVPRHTLFPGQVSLNEGIHFTGGEPFLNFDLLLRLTEIAQQLGFPSTFVETNGFWCRDDQLAREQLRALKMAGLDGIMISANPFLLEQVPFERTERAVRISREVFGPNAFTYQQFFFAQFQALDLVTVRYTKTTKGDMALFWSLTARGERLMIQMRTVKSASNKPGGR